ncbi:hypothetical protein LCGC14_1046790 [marine sediment metagenome]|uniref:Band 7 domain-containing protein n=1 Tax=marine sediment metagenome TaxID=412755 RepID=A0A0F9NBV8_9ZZZZ
MVDENKKKLIIKNQTITQEMIDDSFGKAFGLGEEDSDTLEWIPAYFCETSVLKSERSQAFVSQVSEAIFKKRLIRKDKFLEYKFTLVRYSLSDIRSGTLKGMMQNEINGSGFECKLPNEHVRFGGKKLTDPETGETIYTQGCMGRIIAEKIPRIMYHFNKKPTIKNILIREHERVLFTREGRIETVLDAGKHDIMGGAMKFDNIELYYVDVGNIQTRWGTTTMLTDGKGTMTATQVRLKLNGSLIIRIVNLNNFIANIVKNQTEYYEGNIQKYIKDKLIQIINSEMSQAEPISLYQDAEKVMLTVKVKAKDFLQDAGVEIVDLSVGSCKFDDDVEETFKRRLEKIKVEGATADADVERKLQEIKRLKEMGIDIGSYVSKEQDIKIAGAGGISEKEKIKKEIKQLQEKLEELDSKLDNGEISETIWEKRVDRIERNIKELQNNP